MPTISMDLGGTKLATAAFGDEGALVHRDSVLLGGRAGTAVGALAVERCDAMRAHLLELGLGDCTAVGVSVPGIARAETGRVWAPNIPGWDDYPLREELKRAVGPDTAVVIDSDRAACIMGEAWCGAAAGARHAIFLAVGTGIGAGILVDGRVLRGHADIAGAIGWLALDRPFRDPYVGCGCFEHHASGPGLVKAVTELMSGDAAYDGELRHVSSTALTGEQVFAAFDRGDRLATRALDDAVAFWGMAAANLVSLFNPEVIVFGGGVFGPAIRFLDRIRTEATRWAQPIAMQQTRFVASALGGDAAIYGAARLAMLATTATSETIA